MASSASAPPRSDVSAMTGLVGLLGLIGWAMACRYWPEVGAALDLPGPRLPMDGPYAALMALVAAGLPMMLWSLLVDKVHLRASTGIDWANPRRLRAIFDLSITKLAGLWATWALIGFLYCVARWYWQGSWLFAMHVIGALAVPMVVLSVPYVLWLDRVLVEPRDGAWHFGAMLIGREAFEPDQVKKHLRSWAVKGFFTAFMVSILPGNWAQVIGSDPARMLSDPVSAGNWLTNCLFLIDVEIGTVGYLLTLRPLDAQIRSANPLMAGWVAALICYPPFVLMGGGGPLDYHPYTADWSRWMAGMPGLEWAWAGWLALLTGIYAWATVAFGIRFSNLTYRGVLTNGPYRFSRHPAYLAKNLFWWSATMPFLVTTHSWIDALRDCVVMAMVSGVYFWRAKTEEKHLLAEDAKYRAYWAWMEANGVVTKRFSALWRGVAARWAAGRGAEVQPAE